MMAQGGRVGYNMGGGIMDAAPGVPPGMELDYRESGGFIPMGSQEKKDDVPAVLAKNEFVLTSDAMTGLDKMMGGSGDPRAAAKYTSNDGSIRGNGIMVTQTTQTLPPPFITSLVKTLLQP